MLTTSELLVAAALYEKGKHKHVISFSCLDIEGNMEACGSTVCYDRCELSRDLTSGEF